MKIYVGNLAYKTTRQELIDFFSACGTVVAAKIIMDRQTRRPKGFAFVTFDSAEAMANAIKRDGESLHERALRIAEATARDSDGGSRPAPAHAEKRLLCPSPQQVRSWQLVPQHRDFDRLNFFSDSLSLWERGLKNVSESLC